MKIKAQIEATQEELLSLTQIIGIDLKTKLEKIAPLTENSNNGEIFLQFESSFFNDIQKLLDILGIQAPKDLKQLILLITTPKSYPAWPSKISMMDKAKLGMLGLSASRKIVVNAKVNNISIPLPINDFLLNILK